eukprot:6404555-Lingulodinium_polyedra.AAC.1
MVVRGAPVPLTPSHGAIPGDPLADVAFLAVMAQCLHATRRELQRFHAAPELGHEPHERFAASTR